MPNPWSARELRRRCEEFKSSLLRQRTATEEEIADYWPGGTINTEEHPLGKWIFCYGNLIGMLRRKQPEIVGARVDEAMSAALARDAERVTFEDGVVRSVHAKSYHALRWLDSLDKSVTDAVIAVAEFGADAEAVKAMATLPLIESLAVRTWVWVLTEGSAESNASLPFDESQPLNPPEWTKTLTPKDLLTVFRAHVRINVERLQIIANAFPPDPSNGVTRLSLSGFLGSVAQDMGLRSSDLLRKWSLGEAFAQSVAAAQAARESKERADARAKAG